MKIFTLVFMLIFLSVFFSCNPELVEELKIPDILISSPVEGSYCTNLVEIQGRINWPENNGTECLYFYGTLDTGPEKEIIPDEWGQFRFIMDTQNMRENFFLVIFGYYPNSRVWQSLYYHNLKKIKYNSIPSFALNMEEKIYNGIDEIQLIWEHVPETKEYILSYYVNTQYPSDEEIVCKKLELGDSLIVSENGICIFKINSTMFSSGNLYTFYLEAFPSEGYPKSISGKVEVILFDINTFILKFDDKTMQLSWNNIPGTDRFFVYQRINDKDEFIKISGIVNGNQYSDFSENSNSNLTSHEFRIVPYFNGVY